MTQTNHITLIELPVNDCATIRSFATNRLETHRLASLGLTPGAKVNMTQNHRRGPLIVTVRGTRVALGRGEAARIIVERRIAE
jgi:ferrous iron transport protein A